MNLKEFKQLLRDMDYFGDRWGVVIHVFFDLSPISNELLCGNREIGKENIFFPYMDNMSSASIAEIWRYMVRLIESLSKTEHAY